MALGHLICYASYLFAVVTAHKVRGHYSLPVCDGDVTQCGTGALTYYNTPSTLRFLQSVLRKEESWL